MERNIVSAFDVAKYILDKSKGAVTAMQMHKLLYYCQAWSLVWDSSPLFSERIEAWANGPVVPDIYGYHRLQYFILDLPKGDPNVLNADQIETIDAVLSFYGNKSPQWLSDLTHMERPWQNARVGLRDGERGNQEIILADMAEYYTEIFKK